MGSISGYILSLVCTSVLCGLIVLLFEKNTPAFSAIKLVLGIVMTITVLDPLIRQDVFSLDSYFEKISDDCTWTVDAGSDYAKSLQEELIKDKTETYILEKAVQLGADITVDVSLDEKYLPIAACFSGRISPYAKKQLEDFVKTQLAIKEEYLTWE